MTALSSWSLDLLLGLLPWAADPVPQPEDVKPGWIAFVVVMSLVAASVLLWFSMRKQLGRIRVPHAGADADDDSPTAEGHPTDSRP